MTDNKTTKGCPGFTSLLLLLFIGLKLSNIIDWSWWWVLSPVWVPISIVALFTFIAGIANYIAERQND
jgi:hypothetical protein